MLMVEPFAAASIITPMMLLAFTRRPLRDSHTSQGYCEASWVSLAEARACSPSLLIICASCCSIAAFRFNSDNTFFPAIQCALHQFVQRFVVITGYAQQHWQVDPRDTFDASRLAQPPRDIAGRRP